MAFDITKYLENNKIELGSIKKEVGTSISKSGQNDLRKTQYDVKIKDGKFDLSTHTSIMTESRQELNEGIKSKLSEDADSINPRYMFSDTDISLLLKIANGKIDAKEYAKFQLQNLGLGKQGEWIGFNAAEKLWKSKIK